MGVITKPASLEPTIVTVTESGENEGGGLYGKSEIAVTGHSLGGHLAMIMSRLAPNLVKSVLTFNSPRFDTNLSFDWSTIPLPRLTLSSTALTSEGFLIYWKTPNIATLVPARFVIFRNIGEIVNTRIAEDVV